MKTYFAFILILFLSCAHSSSGKIETVSHVDLQQYLGKWYEIGRITHSFQKDCGASTAEYSLNKNSNKILVKNSCINIHNGEIDIANGVASVVDTQSNAKLKVSFVPLFKWLGWFSGNYWILELDEDYQFALIGEPSREYLWILSRTPTMDQYTKDRLLDIARENGYSLEKFSFSPTWNK